MKYLSLLLGILSLSNCTHYYYTPNTLNIPYLREQHDATVSAGYYHGYTDVKGLEVKSAYSPIRYTGLMLNHLHIRKGGDSQDWGRGRLTEFGLGGYWPTAFLSLSAFAGYGWGLAEHGFAGYRQVGREPISAELAFDQWFVQPNLAFQWDFLRMGLGVKRQRLRYTKGDVAYYLEPTEFSPIRRIEQQRRFDYWQLNYSCAFNFRLFSLNMDASRIYGPYDFMSFRLNETGVNLGIGLNIDEFFKKRAKKPVPAEQ
jgi:hypothetical protein